ncbi:sec7 domain containing protein [Stylonychia lemnae]|uniref:Sec7 domain containing protein n=1 Tax=Stylonychia lemnae TaxID=5949 RepID=A0A078BC62_STYLE|nr:sec7 domain containing protein [Stylonychia lemnae]|eukprot:CDW90832.1 sec7 domain containing protein [Stylonychia lemnae]
MFICNIILIDHSQYQKQIPDEQRVMKDKLNQVYQELLLNHHQSENQSHLLNLINALLENIKNPALLGSLWKATLKTLIKILGYQEVVDKLIKAPEFDTQQLINTLMTAQFETIDVQEEEQMLILIQKAFLRIVISLQMSEDYQYKIFKYFMKILKKKSIEDSDQTYSMQFADVTKKNLHKVLYHFMAEDEEHQVKYKVMNYYFAKIKKTLTKIQQKPISGGNKLREYACFSIKTLEDCLNRISTQEELTNIIVTLKDKIIETLCICGEFDDIMIRNQAQQAFTLVLKVIVENKIPLREELELLLIKVALKPCIQLAKKLVPNDLTRSSSATSESKPIKENCSDDENEDFIQINPERSVQDDLLLEMNVNFLIETILLLRPEQIASLYLMYDCQPFSENFITKSLLMIFKVAQKDSAKYLSFYQLLVKKLSQLKINPQLVGDLQNSGPQSISFMLEQKSTVKKLVKDANLKFKLFMQKTEEMYAYADDQVQAEVQSKILLFSREILIEKVAEIIGGKEEKYKKLLSSYLDKMDYKESDIDESLRKFLQTFRLAGVDSQVVLRILEQFSHRFFENDKKGIFFSKGEAYEFAYLIIVLQTCQHNPSVKQKTDIKAFIESADLACPKSKDKFDPAFIDYIYNSVTNNAFYTPNSRSLIDENFNQYNLNEIQIRLSKCNSLDQKISENEFINSADLAQKQIFNYSNSTEVPQNLILLGVKHLVFYLTQKFVKYNLVTNASTITQDTKEATIKKFDILENLAQINKTFKNYDSVDRIFQVIYKVIHHTQNEQLYSRLDDLLWGNFDCIKRSLVLLPKLSMQSFMRDQIKDSLQQSFTSVMRLLQYHHQEKRKQKQAKLNHHEKNAPQKAASFFDLVYNYFTDNNEDQSLDDKNDQAEIDAVVSIRKKILMEDKEGDYMEQIEEKFDDKTGQQRVKEKTRIQELITLVCACIRENLNQEEGILCLAFLEHLIAQSDQNLETQEKIWVELHLLLNMCLKNKPLDLLSVSSVSSLKEERKQEYEVISTNTSQDSIDSSSAQNDLDFFVKESCQIKTKINETITRHLILALHLKSSKKLIDMKQDNQHIIRDAQRLISFIIESDLQDKTLENMGTFDDMFLFNQLHIFSKDSMSFKKYQKLSKLIRLKLILLLRSVTKKLDDDQESHKLSLKKFAYFNTVSQLLGEFSSQLPYDQIQLAIEIFEKLHVPNTKSQHTQQLLENAIQVIDNLGLALQRQILINEENKLEIWFKLIQTLQEKILYNQVTKRHEIVAIQGFNVVKNLVLNHPFDIDTKNFTYIRRLFADILFWQTFENLSQEIPPSNAIGSQSSKAIEEVKKQSSTAVALNNDDSDEEFDENIESQLEATCQFCVNNLSDIFIYYISIIFRDPLVAHQPDRANSENPDESSQKLFSYLWLNLLKVLLHYGEKSHTKDFQGLIHSIHDNIKRVIEFLIQQGILRDDSPNQDMQKLWKTSWEIIGAFFVDMKIQVLGPNYKENI